MKIICIGRNYLDHVLELGNRIPEEPVIFMKPDSAIMRQSDNFYIPDWTNDVHYEVEIVLKINRLGKNVEAKFAHKYYDQIGLGIDFTARDLQTKLKSKGLPWEKAKGFDQSAVVGDWIDVKNIDLKNVNFSLLKNGELVQSSNTSLMIYPCNELVSYCSKYFTLKIGDLLYTGTPKGVGPVKPGDKLEGYIEDQKLLSLMVK